MHITRQRFLRQPPRRPKTANTLARFVPPDVFNPAADDALRNLSDTDALIIDMRDNGGGHPGSVAYLASFFLDPGVRVHINDLIWRNCGTSTFRTESFWSSATPVSCLGKPVYVLIGPKTYSAGEEFAYDLQVLKRVTVAGEATRGGANPGGLNDLGFDLFVVVPTGRAENPITGGNWGAAACILTFGWRRKPVWTLRSRWLRNRRSRRGQFSNSGLIWTCRHRPTSRRPHLALPTSCGRSGT